MISTTPIQIAPYFRRQEKVPTVLFTYQNYGSGPLHITPLKTNGHLKVTMQSQSKWAT